MMVIKMGKAVEILNMYEVPEITPYLLQPDTRFLRSCQKRPSVVLNFSCQKMIFKGQSQQYII
jgi:hypothetical protein